MKTIVFLSLLIAVNINVAGQTNTFPATGRVGIGTTNPNTYVNLDVLGNIRVTKSLFVDRTDGSLTNYFAITSRGAAESSNFGNPLGNGAAEIVSFQTPGLILGTVSSGDVVLGTSNIERLRITASGNIGIGTNAPGSLLDVNGSSRFRNALTVDYGTPNRRVQLRDNGLYISRTSEGSYVSTITADGSMHFDTRDDYFFKVDGTYKYMLSRNGNMGIGTTSPLYKLTVQGTSGTVAVASLLENQGEVGFYSAGNIIGAVSLFDDNLNATGAVIGTLKNTNGSSNQADAKFVAAVTGANGGSPSLNLSVMGVTDFTVGVHNGDGDKFKISNGILGTNDRLVIDGGGLVGIGTSTPRARLDVNGSAYAMGDFNNQAFGSVKTESLQCFNGAAINYFAGKLAIGTNDPAKIGSYSLAVNGEAIFNKARVKLYGSWPDYVFRNDYRLMPLDELEKFIGKNKHLPEVPPESEVADKGIDLGEHQALLLKKIEELTLYLIEQKKEIDRQKQQLLKQQQEIERLKDSRRHNN